MDDTSYKPLLMNEVMASCHSISIVKEQMLGDPMEIAMFQSTGWYLENNYDVKETHHE